MIVGIGSDLLDVARMESELQSGGRELRERVFTADEARYCDAKRYPARHYAARFAAKEALFKALSPGKPRPAIAWRDVEVRSEPDGRPRIVLHGAARDLAARLGVKSVFVSLTHTGRLASANVVLEA